METALTYIVPVALGAVLVVLGLGIYSLYRGGDFGRSYSNKLMRLRVVLQFIAIILVMATVYFTGEH